MWTLRVVFDSNIWIAALAASGTSKEVVQEALRLCEVFISPYIFQEVDRVLARKIGATAEECRRVRDWLESVCQVVESPVPKDKGNLSCPDPKDLPILWLAMSVHADLLVTGDKELLKLAEVRGLKVVSPGMFWHARLSFE